MSLSRVPARRSLKPLRKPHFSRFTRCGLEPLEDRRLLTLVGIDTTQPPAAVLIEFPRIQYDNSGITTYNATTNAFDVVADALTFQQISGGAIRPITNKPIPSVEIHIVVDENGELVSGTAGDDLTISGDIDVDGNGTVDFTGVLLTGEILQFGFLEQGPSDKFDFRFRATGGALLPFYSSGGNVVKDIGIVQTVEPRTQFPAFTGSFETNFGGNAKGTEGPIAELSQEILLKKYVSTEDGDFDNGDCDMGPFVQVGDPVTFKYVITNNGDVTYKLADVKLIDDNGTPADTTDDFDVLLDPNAVLTEGLNSNNGILDIDEVWTITLVRVPSSTTGIDPYTNTAQVTGAPSADANGHLVVGLPDSVSNEDDANVCILDPVITLVKTAIEDPDCEHDVDGTGVVPVVALNDTVTFRYDITNPDTDLAARLKLSLKDDNGTPDDDTDDIDLIVDGDLQAVQLPATLTISKSGPGDDAVVNDNIFDPGELWVVLYTIPMTELGYYRNVATATGVAVNIENGEIAHIDTAIAIDDAKVFVAQAAINIEKRVNGEDANDDQGPFDNVTPGSQVTYTYLVTNNGNVILDFLTDGLNSFFDDGGPDDDNFTPSQVAKLNGKNIGDANDDGKFNPGESWEFVKLNVVLANASDAPYRNVVKVIGTPVDFSGTAMTDCLQKVDDSDEANINVVASTQPVLASLAGYVYQDCNNNGIRDNGESGIADVPIQLTGTTNGGLPVSISGVTGPLGAYSFTGLEPGTYTVKETTQPAGFFDGKDRAGMPFGGDATSVNDQISGIIIVTGQAGFEYNFGELPPSSFSGYVYVDVNNNGHFDKDKELPFEGVKITFTGKDYLGVDVPTQVVYTGPDGKYAFVNLPPGKYYITEGPTASYLDGKDTPGTAPGSVVVKVGVDPVFDQFFVDLGACTDIENNNFGERGELVPSKRPFIFSNGNWHNPSTPLDANADGQLTAVDALIVIDAMKRLGLGSLPQGNDTHDFPDVDGDGVLSAADALAVINQLKHNSSSAAAARAASLAATHNAVARGLAVDQAISELTASDSAAGASTVSGVTDGSSTASSSNSSAAMSRASMLASRATVKSNSTISNSDLLAPVKTSLA